MRVAVSGASGLLGSALVDALEPAHEVVRLVRRVPTSYVERRWDPSLGIIEGQGLADVDAVVNLSGAGLADARLTPARKHLLLESRVRTTATLHRYAAESDRCAAMLSASAVGYYGNTGDEVVDESDANGRGFLAGLVTQWEGAAPQVEGLQVSWLRTGQVLTRRGGVLGKQAPLFRMGLGGVVGDGQQWISWISCDDWVRAVMFVLERGIAGPINLVSPNPVTNEDFTERLGHVLRRPTRVPLPLPLVRRVLGRELVNEALLFSTRAVPRALEDEGFVFDHPDLGVALRALYRTHRQRRDPEKTDQDSAVLDPGVEAPS